MQREAGFYLPIDVTPVCSKVLLHEAKIDEGLIYY
jgi:hypothetical protein